MLQLTIATDEFGSLTSTVTNGRISASATASDKLEALSSLQSALDGARSEGVGECFWPREAGAYRWVMRKEGERGRLMLLWSIGTMTGWENLFWTEDEWRTIDAGIASGLVAARQDMC